MYKPRVLIKAWGKPPDPYHESVTFLPFFLPAFLSPPGTCTALCCPICIPNGLGAMDSWAGGPHLTWHGSAAHPSNCFWTETRWGRINGLVSAERLLLAAVDVPVNAKNGITARQTTSLRPDRRLPSRLGVLPCDECRTLPAAAAECTCVSSSITLSQHSGTKKIK